MLRKLIRHEMTATARIMLPMLLIVLLAAVGGNLSTYQLLEADNGFLSAIGVLLLMGFVLSIFAACILSFVLMIRRFYKNLLSDEGYLMMTLPVTVHEHIVGKLIVSVVWFALTGLTVFLSIFILLFQAEPAMRFIREVAEIFGVVIRYQYGWHALVMGVELLLIFAAGTASMCLGIYAAMAIGHSFTSRKTLLSFAAYFLMQFGFNVVQQGVVSLFDRMGAIDSFLAWMERSMTQTALADGTMLITPALTAVHLVLLGALAITLIDALIFELITAYFMKNRLNLA